MSRSNSGLDGGSETVGELMSLFIVLWSMGFIGLLVHLLAPSMVNWIGFAVGIVSFGMIIGIVLAMACVKVMKIYYGKE